MAVVNMDRNLPARHNPDVIGSPAPVTQRRLTAALGQATRLTSQHAGEPPEGETSASGRGAAARHKPETGAVSAHEPGKEKKSVLDKLRWLKNEFQRPPKKKLVFLGFEKQPENIEDASEYIRQAVFQFTQQNNANRGPSGVVQAHHTDKEQLSNKPPPVETLSKSPEAQSLPEKFHFGKKKSNMELGEGPEKKGNNPAKTASKESTWSKMGRRVSRIFKGITGTSGPSSPEEDPKDLKKHSKKSKKKEFEELRASLFPPESESDSSDSDSDSDLWESPEPTKIDHLVDMISSLSKKVKCCSCKPETNSPSWSPKYDTTTTESSSSVHTSSSSSYAGGIKQVFMDTESVYSSASLPPMLFSSGINASRGAIRPREESLDDISSYEEDISQDDLRDSLEISLYGLFSKILSKSKHCNSTSNFDTTSNELLEKIMELVGEKKLVIDCEYIRTKLHKLVYKELCKLWGSPDFILSFIYLGSRVVPETIARLYKRYLTRDRFTVALRKFLLHCFFLCPIDEKSNCTNFFRS